MRNGMSDQDSLLDDPFGSPAPEADDDVVDPAVAATTPSTASRVGRRIVRRPMNWLNRPWPAERIAQYLTALVVVGGCTFAVLKVIHLDLVFANNTPTGGDMGAHVMAPAYLRDHLLPHFQIQGWSNYWYNGFPLYRFYMVIPALMIVFLNVFLPYGIAFKVVACLGIVTLPFCCWAFGRLARFRFPIPELMALAAIVFLFDESFSIYGGNVKSTMAGEFSFSIALSFAMLGLGLFARGLETGKFRNWAAIVLALAILSHGIVAIFVVIGALLMWLVWMDKTRFVYGLTMGVTAVMLSAFWIIPFVFNHQYMTDMKYGFRPDGVNDSFWNMFFQYPVFWDLLVSGFAVVGFVSSVVKRNLTGAWLGIMCLALMALTYVARDSLPVIGLLWNPRVLPFLYLVRLLLCMVGIVDTVHFVIKGVRQRDVSVGDIWVSGVVTAAVVSIVVLVVQLFSFQEMPGARFVTKNDKAVYSWGIAGWDLITLTPSAKDALSDGWTKYNFQGYEGRPAYGEYKGVIDTMANLGKSADEGLGCGRALWENNGDTGAYGTTMALMLLPHWTDGCIASQEGLFFEASGTTPYHFLTAAAMSANSSNPVRELRYTDNDAAVGVPMMQKMGIKYLMVFTKKAKDQADTRSDLKLVATTGPWKIYTVDDSPVVVPLSTQPVVVNGRGGDQRERHLELGTSWFQNPNEWAAMPADDGPADWQRIDVQVDMSRRVGNEPLEPGRKVDIVVPVQTIEPKALEPITVSNYHMGDQDLSFDVSKVGVPVLVKVSYFPNWTVEGAKGPYRVAPNFMVVVPTSTHVTMSFESSGVDKLAYLLTFLGIILMVFWRFKIGDVQHRSPHPFLPGPAPTPGFDDEWVEYGAAPFDGPPPPPSPDDDTVVDVTWTGSIFHPPSGAPGDGVDSTPPEGAERPPGSV